MMISTLEKIVDRETLGAACEKLRAQGRTIVTCNGSFDLFPLRTSLLPGGSQKTG